MNPLVGTKLYQVGHVRDANGHRVHPSRLELVECAVLRETRAGMLVIEPAEPNFGTKRILPAAVGRWIFRTPREAVRRFVAERRRLVRLYGREARLAAKLMPRRRRAA